jgi:hypothetical protein
MTAASEAGEDLGDHGVKARPGCRVIVRVLLLESKCIRYYEMWVGMALFLPQKDTDASI